MTSKNVSFYQAPGKAEIERKRRMAAALMEQGKQPDKTEMVSGWAVKQSPIAGLAKALSTGLGGYAEGQAVKAEEAKADAARQAMADALSGFNKSQEGGTTQLKSGESINWNTVPIDQASQQFAQALMANEDTAPIGMQAAIGNMTAKQNNANELELYKQKFPMELELAKQKAILDAKYGAAPSTVQEWQFYNSLPPQDQERFLTMKRANKVIDLGGTEIVPSQTNPSGPPQATFTVTPEPDNMPDFKREQERAKKEGERQGEASGKLASLEAAMPRLEEVTNKLSELGKAATYTQAGQVVDATKRQLGQPVGPGAVARTEYMSTIDNEVLPLLRDTFGAQFTEREGESLKATLGDVNKSPEEKDAALRSFIASKVGQVETLKRQTGQTGKVRVSNGSETFEIDPKDLPDAQAEGFNPL